MGMKQVVDSAVLAMEREYDRGHAAGLAEAKRRLSLAGLHDARCQEPAEPCDCGLDMAIDTVFPPNAVAAWSQPVSGDVN